MSVGIRLIERLEKHLGASPQGFESLRFRHNEPKTNPRQRKVLGLIYF